MSAKVKGCLLALLIAGGVMAVLCWPIIDALFISYLILDFRSRPAALEDTSRNWNYDFSWHVKNYPYWISDNEVGYIEQRMFEECRDLMQFRADDYPEKTEFWLVRQNLRSGAKSETFLLADLGLCYPGRSERQNDVPLFQPLRHDDEMALFWSTSSFTPCRFALLKNNEVIWSNAVRKKGRRLPGAWPITYDWTTRRLLIERDLKWWWCSLDESLPVRHLEGPGYLVDATYFWVQDRLFGCRWDDATGTVDTYEFSSLDGRLIKRSALKSDKRFLGVSVTPTADRIALGAIGIFTFSPDAGIGAHIENLELIHPDWDSSGRRLVGLGPNRENLTYPVHETDFNTVKVIEAASD